MAAGEEQDWEAQQDNAQRWEKEDGPGKGTLYLDAKDVNPVNRYPTDCLCCCGFIACLLAMMIVVRQSVQQEHPFKILHPLDHEGNSCGLGDYADYPLVYYPALQMINGGKLVADVYYSNPRNLHSVCTKKCPTSLSRENRLGMCPPKAAASDYSGVYNLVNGTDNMTAAAGSTVAAAGNATVAAGKANATAPGCTWYSEMPAKLFLSQYCIFGNGLMNSRPDRTGTACQSAQQAVSDVEEEALQSLDDMGNATRHYLRYLNGTLPAIYTNPAITRMLTEIETNTTARVATFKTAVKNAGVNNTENNLVQVCKDAVGKQKNFLTDFLADVLNSWKVLVTSLAVSLVVGGMYLFFVCLFVKAVVWGSCIACIIGFALAGWLFWDEAIQVADTGLIDAPASEEKVLAVLCWIVSLICLVILVACRRALHLGIAISSATSSFLMKNAGIMIMPQLLAIVQVVFIVYWLFGLSAILSTAEILPAANVTQEHNRYLLDDTIKVKIIFHFFVGFWVNGFLEGVGTIATGITVTDWYYLPKVNGKKPTNHMSFVSGLRKAIFFHAGSAAFGSLIVSIVQTMRVVLELYVKVITQMVGKTAAKYLAGCCRCVLGFLAARLRYISYNSYLMVGVSGKGFLTSASEAGKLILRNPMRFVAFNGVMWTVNAIGRFIIVGITLAWGALLMNKTLFPGLSKDVHSPWPVLMCIMIISWMVSGIIFGVFTTSGASLFYNFVCDEEVSGYEGVSKDSYAPGDLGKLLAAEAKRRKKSEKPEDDSKDQGEEDYDA